MLFQRTKIRRFRRERNAENATDWLARCSEAGADTVTAPTQLDGHLPGARSSVRPGTPFTRSLPAPRRPRVIPGNRAAADEPTQELAPVPAPTIPQLFIPSRAPQPSASAPNPVAVAQAVPGHRTYILTVPPKPTYAELLADVFDAAASRLTRLSGWVNNRSLRDDEVTHQRFMGLRDRFADFLPPLPVPAFELVAA